MTTPDKHQLRILIETVRHPMKQLLGGPSYADAVQILKKKYNYTNQQIYNIKNS